LRCTIDFQAKRLPRLAACLDLVNRKQPNLRPWRVLADIRAVRGILALAFYLAAAEVINETRGKVVLPIAPYRER
jgi:hypothetical protein